VSVPNANDHRLAGNADNEVDDHRNQVRHHEHTDRANSGTKTTRRAHLRLANQGAPMALRESIPRRIRRPLRMVPLCAAAAAAAGMGIVTAAASSPGIGGDSSTFSADPNTVTSPIPATTPAIASAGPRVKPTTFNGGHWPGMGSFGADWAK
jgi:hypothetical protein